MWRPIKALIALHQLNGILAWVMVARSRNAAPIGQYNQATVAV